MNVFLLLMFAATSQSAMMRSNRHMVFLPEHHHHQQQMSHQQHCGYPDDMRLSYEAKMQDDLARRLHPASYQPQDQQVNFKNFDVFSNFKIDLNKRKKKIFHHCNNKK